MFKDIRYTVRYNVVGTADDSNCQGVFDNKEL